MVDGGLLLSEQHHAAPTHSSSVLGLAKIEAGHVGASFFSFHHTGVRATERCDTRNSSCCCLAQQGAGGSVNLAIAFERRDCQHAQHTGKPSSFGIALRRLCTASMRR